MVASAFPLGQVWLDAAQRREAADAAAATDPEDGASAPGVGELPFQPQDGNVVAPPSDGGAPADGLDGPSSRPGPASSQYGARASGSVLLDQVMGSARVLGLADVQVPDLPVDQLAAENPLRAAILAWMAATQSQVAPDVLARELAKADALPLATQRDIALLLLSAVQATELQHAALARLTPAEYAWVLTHPEVAEDLAAGRVTTDTKRMAALSGLVDQRKSIEATLLMVAAVEATRGTLAATDEAQETLLGLSAAELDPVAAALLEVLATAGARTTDVQKVQFAAELVAAGAGIAVPAPVAAPSFEAALADLLAATAQTPDAQGLALANERASRLPADLNAALAQLLVAEAAAVRASDPAHLTPTSQAEALAATLVAVGAALPTLEKYALYWRNAPDALRMGEWSPEARLAWAANHVAMLQATRGDASDLVTAVAYVTGAGVVDVEVPERSFVEAYEAIAAQAGFPVTPAHRAELAAAAQRLSPDLRAAAAILMSGAAESARLHALAFAGLSAPERDFLLTQTFGLDALYDATLTESDLRRLGAAVTLAERVDERALAQSGLVAVLATEQARAILDASDDLGVQGRAAPVETGFLAFLKRLLPIGAARAQEAECEDTFAGTTGALVMDDCKNDVLLRIDAPMSIDRGYTCDQRECWFHEYPTQEVLVITGPGSSVQTPQVAQRQYCDLPFTAGFDPNCFFPRYKPVYKFGAPIVTLDLGGADSWSRPVAVTVINATLPVSLHLDMGGTDVYADPSSLYDERSPLAAAIGFRNGHPTQGSALFGGAAVLLDAGTEEDSYQAGVRSQGFGRYGLGMLFDVGGVSTYTARGVSQGVASDTMNLGAGILLDTGDDDTYVTSTGQGYGLGGVLLDVGGSDTYGTDDPPSGVPVVHLDVVPGGDVTTFDERADNRAWLDGPGSANLGIGYDTEVVLTATPGDDDGYPDVVEFIVGTDPYDASSSPDTNATVRVDALVTDGDGDVYPDYIERALSTDPEDPTSYPAGFPSGPGLVLPAAVMQQLHETGLATLLGVESGSIDPLADEQTVESPRGHDKIVDLRLPLQDAGTLDFACTGEFYPNMTTGYFGNGLADTALPSLSPAEPPMRPLANYSTITVEDRNGNFADRPNPDEPRDERNRAEPLCLYVSYTSSGGGQGNASLPREDNPREENAFTYSLPGGILAVGDVVSTAYSADYFVVVDLGGDDRFSNSAGGGLFVATRGGDASSTAATEMFVAPSLVVNVDPSRYSDLIEPLATTDRYVNASRQYAHGSFFGVLVDNAGNDTYTAGSGSQGTLGGILLDLDGSDRYTAGDLSQGASLATGTNDRIGNRSDLPDGGALPETRLAGQAGDSTVRRLAPGMLLDLSSDDSALGGVDRYVAGNHSQGFARGFVDANTPNASASPLAIGILLDQSGIDTYSARRHAQGVSGTDGLGILVDLGYLPDTYSAQGVISHGATISSTVGTNNQVYPQGPRPAFALLADLGGRDVYRVDGVGRDPDRNQGLVVSRSETGMGPGASGRQTWYGDVGVHLDTTLRDVTGTPDLVAFLGGVGGTGTEHDAVGTETAGDYLVDLPTARLAIGGQGATDYEHDYAFVVDLGGDNSYAFSAGGVIRDLVMRGSPQQATGTWLAQGEPYAISLFPVTFVLDAGRGNSSYTAPTALSQGAGLFSVGMLVDLGGNDEFVADAVATQALRSSWPEVAPVIDGSIGADEWASIDAQAITLRSLRDDRYESEWKLRVANDGESVYVALEGVTTSDASERKKDKLVIDFDMGRRHLMWDADANRTGIDAVYFEFSDGGFCRASDRGFSLSRFNAAASGATAGQPIINDRDAPGGTDEDTMDFGCRFTEDGRVFYELRKQLLEDLPRDAFDLGYCYNETLGFGYMGGRGCGFGPDDAQVGLHVEFFDAGASVQSAQRQHELERFTWPPGTQDTDDGQNGTRRGTLSDEMARWQPVSLAELGRDGAPLTDRILPQLSQGAALAGVGVLAMLGTAPASATLHAGDMSQAYGAFGGVAILLDAGGSDLYSGARRVQGSAETGGVALFLEAGGHDNFLTLGQSNGWSPDPAAGASQGNVGYSLFADLGGEDQYAHKPRSLTNRTDLRQLSTSLGGTPRPPYGNDWVWAQNNSVGVDYRVADSIENMYAGILAQSLYGSTRTQLSVSVYDPTALDRDANGCTLRAPPLSPGSTTLEPRYQVAGKICLRALVDTGNGSLMRSVASARDALPLEYRDEFNGTVSTVDVRNVDFLVGRQRMATALAPVHTIDGDKSVWSAVVDLTLVPDGAARVKALPTFSAEVQGMGVLLFQSPVNQDDLQSTAARTITVNNPPSISLKVSPEFSGTANATFAPYAAGPAQKLFVNWSVSHDAAEDRLEAFQGWTSPPNMTNYPCTLGEDRLCRTLPFYFPYDSTDGNLDTTPGGEIDRAPHRMVRESASASAPYGRQTNLLRTPLSIELEDSFRVAIPNRTPLSLGAAYTTTIRISLEDSEGKIVQDGNGAVWYLGFEEATTSPPFIDGATALNSLAPTIRDRINTVNSTVNGALDNLEGNILYNVVKQGYNASDTAAGYDCTYKTNYSTMGPVCEQLNGDFGQSTVRLCRPGSPSASNPLNTLFTAGTILFGAIKTASGYDLCKGGLAKPVNETAEENGNVTVLLNDTGGGVSVDCSDLAGLCEERSASPEGWSDFFFEVNRTPPDARYGIVYDGATLTIPPGYRILYEQVLTGGGVTGAAVGRDVLIPTVVDPVADALGNNEYIPDWVNTTEYGAPVPFSYDLQNQIANVTVRSKGRDTATSVDDRANLKDVPASIFWADSGGPTFQPRLEIKIPADLETSAEVTIVDASDAPVVTLKRDGVVAGDLNDTPTRDGGRRVQPLDPSRIVWRNNGTDRWTQSNESFSDASLEDGLYKVRVVARDQLRTDGERAVTRTESLLVDRTPPVTIVTTDLFAGSATLVSGSVPIRWAAFETGAGLNQTFVYVYTGPAEGIADPNSWYPLAKAFPQGIREHLVKKETTDLYYVMTIGVDRAGNVEGSANAVNLSEALIEAVNSKLALGFDAPNGPKKITVDEGRPVVSGVSLTGGRGVNYQGSDFAFVRAGQQITFSVCARDPELPDGIGAVVLALDHIEARTGRLTSHTYKTAPGGRCGADNEGRLFVNDTWHLANTLRAAHPEGVWAATFDVYDKAGNRLRVPAGNLVLDHDAPTVRVEDPVLPAGQTAVRPGDLVKIRLLANDTFGVDDDLIRVDASALNKSGAALATRPVRVNGVIYQEAQFVVDDPRLDNRVYEVVVKVPDLAGNVTVVKTHVAVNFQKFTFVPGSLQVTDVRHNSVVLRWKTSEPTSAQVRFGATEQTLTGRTPLDINASIEHAVRVEGLAPSTSYVLRAVSSSTGGYTNESEAIRVTTTTALFLQPVTPKAGDKLSGNVRVAFKGGLLDSTDFVRYQLDVRAGADKPWTFVTTLTRQGEQHEVIWNSTRFLDGAAYELRISAEAGKDTASVTIGPLLSDNTPAGVTVLSPLLATNDTTPRIVAEARDGLAGFGVEPAQLFIDGKPAAGAIVVDSVGQGAIRLAYDVAEPLASGHRLFELRVRDRAGALAIESWRVAIDGEAPNATLHPIRYAPGTAAARLGGTVTLNVTFRDVSGVAYSKADTSALCSGTPETRLVKIAKTDTWQGTCVVTAPDASATKRVTLSAVDLAGNELVLGIDVPVDNVAPTMEATSIVALNHTRAVIEVPANEPILVNGTATAPNSPPVTAATRTLEAKPRIAFDGLLPSRTYAFVLTVADRAGNAVPLAGSFATQRDVLPPGDVGVLSVADLRNGTLRLSWSPALDDVGVSHYRVYRSADTISFQVVAEVKGTTFDDGQLPFEKQYTYKVAAVDHGGNEGPAEQRLRAAATAVPQLSAGLATPTVGSVSTTFRYTITYTSAGGVSPKQVRVILDGVPQDMTYVSGSALTGAVYQYETRLAPHKRDEPHTYAYEASDGRYTVRFPEDGSVMRGPLVSGDVLADDGVTGLASFAQRVPLGGVAGVGVAVLAAIVIAGLATRSKKGGSK